MDITLPLVLSLVGLFVFLVLVLFFCICMRRSHCQQDSDNERLSPEPTRNKFRPTSPNFSQSTSHITPFPPTKPRPSRDTGSPFEQQPNLRIATRRDDGVWLFSDPTPDAPFSPAGTTDLSPSPSVTSLLLREKKRSRCNSQKSHHHDVVVEPPPPAYTRGPMPDKASLPVDV